METETTKVVIYRRYKRNNHYTPAPGYNCPTIPNNYGKQPDYEVVKVVGGNIRGLKNRKIIITWGLNVEPAEFAASNHVVAVQENGEYGEIVLGVC